jgi:hypothetical protein
MAHLVFTTQAAADAFTAGIDADFGYPKPNVVCQGGAAAPRGNTTRYASTLKHPNRSEWAYPEDPVVAGKEGRVPIGTATRQTLDATWNGATSNFMAPQELA